MFLKLRKACSCAVTGRVFLTAITAALICAKIPPAACSPRPHIVFILADDMGWNDVSFHGSNQIPTPNLDVLASEGIILHSYYTMQMCTPSRSALLTGLYPIRTGMQSSVIYNDEPWGLPLSLKIMPEHFKDLGYEVHLIGKWHLGFFQTKYTPLRRGFDSFYGLYTGRSDYYDHTSGMEHIGLDLRDNEKPDWGQNGTYATHLFTEKFVSLIEKHDKSKPFFGYFSHIAPHVGGNVNPFQAPEKAMRKFSYIGDKERSYYAGMVDALDESVGAVVEALNRTGMLNDTIIVFSSDNGADLFGKHLTGASSWPLRGCKATLWEGGLRAPGFVWSTRLKRRRRMSRQLMHIVDWLPTLYSAAGGSVSHLGPMDGFDMWHALSEGTESPRREILHNVDPLSRDMALRVGRYKLLVQAPRNETFIAYRKDRRHPPKGMSRPRDDLTRLRAASRTAKAFKPLYGPLHCETDKNWTREATVNCGPAASMGPPGKAPYLFDIERDPCETHNMAGSQKQLLHSLYKRLSTYVSQMVPPRRKPEDPRSYPENFGGVWSPWLD